MFVKNRFMTNLVHFISMWVLPTPSSVPNKKDVLEKKNHDFQIHQNAHGSKYKTESSVWRQSLLQFSFLDQCAKAVLKPR